MKSREQLIQSLIDDGYLKTPEIIKAFRAIDRADFVRPENKNEAYGNYPLPIGQGQTVSQPLTVAFMLELLEPKPGERILDIGSGSGWQTALLAHAVGPEGKVDAIEVIPELYKFGEENVRRYNFIEKGVVKFYCQDASAELPEGIYDKIIAAATAKDDIPKLWRERLKVGGRIIAPVGGSIKVYRRKSKTEWDEEEYNGFTFVPLVEEVRGTEYEVRRASKNSPTAIVYWLLTFGFLAAGVFSYEIYLPHTDFSHKKEIVITPGLGSRRIGQILKREGVIRSKWLFVAYTSFKGAASSLKPGTYIFFADAAIPNITLNLLNGKNDERAIVIPEGWNSKTIASHLEIEGASEDDEFLRLTAAPEIFIQRFGFLRDKPQEAGLEGYLFPDTYRFHQKTPPEETINKMLANFGQKFSSELRQETARQGRTIFEIITLASLIEKEVTSEEDRALVSGILRKRLRLGIPLQVDATITFITGKKSTRISREETKIDSPYNTYLYQGLPLGPIANPGLSAIRAAIYPQESPYLYYLSTPEGKTIFSRTLKEHGEAKRRYLDPALKNSCRSVTLGKLRCIVSTKYAIIS